MSRDPPSNGELAELLAREAERAETERRTRALRRAGRAALVWEQEAREVHAAGRSLEELSSVGPWLAGVIGAWLDDPPEVPEPPPARRGFRTMAEARATLRGAPPAVRADLQMHTTWSDGRAGLEEMVRAAAGVGRERVLVTDHSKGLRIARGMDEETLRREVEAIEELDSRLDHEGTGIRALPGLEMNLSPEGEGDMAPEALAPLALVLGAFHSSLRVEEDQTERYLRAVRNPQVDVLAHPRGRRYDTRVGLRADWPRVFAAAAEARTALEADAHPHRQDLNEELLRIAAELGAWVSIGSDAHRVEELLYLDLGLAAVVRSGFPRERLLNLLSEEELAAWSRRPRGTLR